jgi:hypothetical protein
MMVYLSYYVSCHYPLPSFYLKHIIGETSRPLEVHSKEHKYKYNLTQGLLEKSKLGQHAHEEGHKIY